MVKNDIYYEDLSLDPLINSEGNVSTVLNEKSIKQSLLMIIETARGSRIFSPDYGCRIKGFLFEPFDEATGKQIGLEIEETLRNYERRIEVVNINVNMDWKLTSYDINVIYRVKNTQTVDIINVKLEKL